MGKSEFQKTFGFEQKRSEARNAAIKSEGRAYTKYKVFTIFTGGLVAFFGLTGVNMRFDDAYVGVWALHKCNIEMALCRDKGQKALDYIQIEKERGEANFYFHIIICEKLGSYMKALRYRNTVDKSLIRSIIEFIGSIGKYYEGYKVPQKVISSLADLLFESVITMEKFEVFDNEKVVEVFRILIQTNDQKTLLKVLISMQIIIENDKSDTFGVFLTEDVWKLIYQLLSSDNPDISQAARDILTYFLISNQKIPFQFKLSL